MGALGALSRRKMLALGAGAAGALAAGCAPRGAQPGPQAAQTPARRTPVTLVYMSPAASGERVERETELFNKFNASSELIKVEVQPGPGSWGELKEKFVVAHAAGTPIDIVQNGWGSWMDLQEGGALTELTAYFTRDKIPGDYLLPKAMEQYSDAGRIWALPITVSADGIAYNMDLFDRAGLKYPPVDTADKSWTMEQFLEYARRLTQGAEQFGLAGRHGYWYNEGHFFGHLGWDDRQKKANFTTAGYRAGLQYWNDLLHKHHVIPTAEQAAAIRGGFTGSIFLTGKIGMAIVGPFIVRREDVAFRWGLATLPYTPSSTNPSNMSGRMWPHGLHVGKSKDPDAVWELFRWLLKPENGGLFPLTAGHAVSPIMKGGSDLAQQQFRERTGIDARAYVLQAQASYPSGAGMLKYAKWDEVNREVTPFWNDFQADRISVNEFTERATRIIEERLIPRRS